MSENVLNSLPPRLVQKAAREAAKFKPRLLYSTTLACDPFSGFALCFLRLRFPDTSCQSFGPGREDKVLPDDLSFRDPKNYGFANG